MRHAKYRFADFTRGRRGKTKTLDRLPGDPSEQEIQNLCDQIQADWSDDEREARRIWMPLNHTLVRPNRADLVRFTIPWVSVG